MMSFGAARPIEDDVCGGHELDLHHASIEWMFARVEWRNPYAFVTGINQVTMFELGAAYVFVRLADERNDDADVADRDLYHGHLLDLREPGIQVPGAGKKHLLLQAAPPAPIQKCLS